MTKGQQAVVCIFAVEGVVGAASTKRASAAPEGVEEIQSLLFYSAYIDTVNAEGMQGGGGGE